MAGIGGCTGGNRLYNIDKRIVFDEASEQK